MVEPIESKPGSLVTRILPLIAFVSVSVVGLILIPWQPTSATADDRILLSAYLWPYDSLCNLPDPGEHLKPMRIGGSIGMKGCRGLDQEWGKPVAVRINLLNAGVSDAEFVIKDLASILLRNKIRGTVAALGFQFRLPDPVVGSTVGIVNEFEGSIVVSVPPGKALDFIILFKHAAVGDSIIISENKPIQITKAKLQVASQSEVFRTPASYLKQPAQNPPASANSSAVVSADKDTPSPELRGVIKDINVHLTKIRIDSNGNPVGEKPDVFLVIEGEGGIETRVRWTDATTLFDAKGKRIKKVAIGKHVKEGDKVSIKTRMDKREIHAVEVHKQ